MTALAMLWLGAAAATAGEANIVGGTPITGMPGVVAVGAISGSQGDVFCTGTVVAPRWVLTAAHCIESAELYETYGWDLYVFEADNLLTGGIDASATWEEVVVHPDYPGQGYDADLALLRISDPVGEVVPLFEGTLDEGWVGQELTFGVAPVQWRADRLLTVLSGEFRRSKLMGERYPMAECLRREL